MSEQVRQTTLTVCDRLASLEGRAAMDVPDFGRPSFDEIPLSAVIDRAGNDELQAFVADVARVRSEFDAILAAGAGVIAKRSERALGYSGLAQSTGDRTAVDMVQRLTGSTRTEAFRQVKLGGAMGEADAAAIALAGSSDSGGARPDGPGSENAHHPPDQPAPALPWYEPLTRAARVGTIHSEAVTVIMRGLGEPNERLDAEALRLAAGEILAEAAGVHADELGRRARQLRDEIDPAGVAIRWDQRYSNRSWRFGRSPDGARTAWVQYDEESAAWADAIVGAAMRPRRGGPRFVDPAEAERAEKLRIDPRSNDQLVFDLMMDLLKAGAEADPTLAFGSRQPGVRVIVTQENLVPADAPTDQSATQANGSASNAGSSTSDTDSVTDTEAGPDSGAESAPCATGTGYFEETGDAVPLSFIERQVCVSGTTTVTVDTAGNPLDVGRDQRLFTARQRIALSIRDGGCQMPDCDRPPSYTEAHHIDQWAAGGKTDLADGILLCPHCHMLVHNNGWKITRVGTDYFAIPPPSVDQRQRPIPLRKKSALARVRRRELGSAGEQQESPQAERGPAS